MSVTRVGLLMSVCLASVGAFSGPARAQSGSPEQTGGRDTSAQASVELDAIVVTARKREEQLEDVPASLSYFDSQYLQDLDVGSGKDLTRITPGLYVIDNGSGFNDEFLIRGEGAARQNNAETGSGLYRNGVFVPGGNAGGRNFIPVDFFDVGSVTVLRGPQGSFFGRNALGGAVNIVSQRPTDQFEGSLDVEYGTNENVSGEAVLNVPVSDRLQFRFGALAVDQSEGFYTSSITGKVLDREESSAFRAQMSWQPSAEFNLNLLLERADEFGPNVIAFSQILPENDPPVNPSGSPSGYSVGRFVKPVDTASFFDRVTETNILEMSWDLGGMTVQSTSAQRNRDARTQSEVDAFGNNKIARLVPTVALGSEKFERFTQDLRLLSNDGGAIDWLIGVEYNKVDSNFGTVRFADAIQNNVFEGLSDVPGVLPAGCSVAPTCTLAQVQTAARNTYRVEDSGIDDTSYAAYAALNWRLRDDLQASFDIRYSNDEKNFELGNVFRLDNPATVPNEQLSRAVVASETFERWTPSASINWQWSDNHYLFGRIATGFRAGGFNNDLGEPGDGVSNLAIPLVYDEEFVTAYEAGVRGRIWRGLRYNINVYRNQKEGTLVNYSVFAGTVATNTIRNVGVLASAGDSVQLGVDGELSARLNFAGGVLSPRLSFAWSDGEYDGGSIFSNAQSNPATTLTTISIDGRRLQRLREWTSAASLIWRFPFGGGLDFVSMASWRGEYGGFEDPQNTNRMDNVSLIDASIGIEGEQWRLVLSGKNVTDESYFNISPGSPAFNAQENEPVTWRIALCYRF
jgi:iron complex outermembrane receptor protein